MPRVTVTSGGGSARYGSKCQACDGYGDIQKLRSEWLCMPCRMNKTTLLTPRNTAERRKDAQRQISERRAANAHVAAQAARASKDGLLYRRRRNAVVQHPAGATRASKMARNRKGASQTKPTALSKQPSREESTAGQVTHSKRMPRRSQPPPKAFESARTRLQEKWNTRLE